MTKEQETSISMASETPAKKFKAAVIGSSGYSGLELSRLLLNHPSIALSACFSRNPEWRLGDILGEPSAQKVNHYSTEELSTQAASFDLIFLATPAKASIELVQELNQALSSGNSDAAKSSPTTVIDLSGAFRLAKEKYPAFYHMEHPAPEWLDQAQYGLQPWKTELAGLNQSSPLQLIANPGCYATAVLMALVPLLKTELVQPETLVIDAKSGATGAGKSAKESLLFTEVDGNCLPYKVGEHQHLPEIVQYVQQLTGVSIQPFFTTHLLPVRRGITAAIYAKVKTGVTSSEILQGFHSHYEDYPLFQVKDLKGTSPHFMSLKQVVGSARTQIGFQLKGDQLYLFSNIDNLLKGAASQALENANLILGRPLTEGLIPQEGLL